MASSFPFSPPAISEDASPPAILGNKIMIAAIITLFCVICFVLLLHLYVRWLWWRIPASHRQYYYGRRIYTEEDSNHGGSPCDHNTGGLEKETIENLPTFTYTKPNKKQKNLGLGQEAEKGNKEEKEKEEEEEEKEEEEEESSVEGLDVVNSECAVCISEFQENEQGRILPLCGHSFHTECIDMWLYSHSTCPLCRALVVVAEVSPSSSTQTVLVVHEQPHDVRPEEEDSHGIDLPTTSFAFWASPLDPDRLALPQTVPSQVVSSPSGTSTPWPSQLSPRVATSCPSPLSPSTASARSVSFSHGVIPSQVSLGMPQARPFQSSRPPPIARRSLSHIRIDVPSSPRSVSISRCQSPRSDQGASPRPLRSPIRSPGIRMAIKRMLSGQSSREKDVCGCSHDHEQGVENMAMKDHSTSTSQDYATLHND